MDLFVTPELEGKTILEIMKKTLGISSALRKHLKFLEDGILLNGEHATVRKVVAAGDLLSLKTEDETASDSLLAVDLPISVIYEDNDIVVPNKPPFMPTHPSRNHYEDTLANALAFRYKSADIPFVFRSVNRLDRNTSGLVLIARNRMAAGYLSEALRNGDIEKTYIAILCGIPEKSEGRIETYMRRTAESIIVRQVCQEGEGGDYALTLYRTLSSNNGYSLVAATPVTGRTHQLRVHFASIGCPILGDDMYGEGSKLIGRHALHAYSLTFPLPSTKERITLTAPLFDDMRSAISALFPDVDPTRLD